MSGSHLHHPNQYGICKDKSTVPVIETLLNTVTAKENKYVVVLSINICGAFYNSWWPVSIMRAHILGTTLCNFAVDTFLYQDIVNCTRLAYADGRNPRLDITEASHFRPQVSVYSSQTKHATRSRRPCKRSTDRESHDGKVPWFVDSRQRFDEHIHQAATRANISFKGSDGKLEENRAIYHKPWEQYMTGSLFPLCSTGFRYNYFWLPRAASYLINGIRPGPTTICWYYNVHGSSTNDRYIIPTPKTVPWMHSETHSSRTEWVETSHESTRNTVIPPKNSYHMGKDPIKYPR